MNSKKLVTVIRLIVERELARRLPKLVKEGVCKELKEYKISRKKPIYENEVSSNTELSDDIDPFTLANSILDKSHSKTKPAESASLKRLSKNPMLNEILNNTKPFSSRGIPAEYNQTAQLDESFKDMNKTVSFDSNIGAAGADGIKAQMAAKMGYGGYSTPNKVSKQGLGVKTGLAGLDRILNRDNSELVSKFKTRK